MKILDRLRNRSPRGDSGDPGSVEARPAHEQRLPIAGYDQFDGKQLIPQLSHLSQVELATVDAHERSHRDRPVVLNRLRWLRGDEPLPGYDALDSDEVIDALADADAATVKAVRSYERHHRDRRAVQAEVARVIPSARSSAGEDRAREDKAALVQAGLRSRSARGTQLMKAESHPSAVERADAARDEREQLRDEARYRRERLDLYRARLYGGRAANQGKLRELQRASDGAAARLRRAEAAAPPTHPPT
jgi:hypothetical protein